MTDSAGSPFRFFSLHVTRTRRISPSLVRVSFAGDDLRHFHSLGYDQSLSLFVPRPGQCEPRVPIELGDDWWQGWRDLPADVRAVMRSYTLRELRRGPDEIDVDFVVHTPAGPASAWAERAVPGDRVVLLGPAVADNRAIRFRAPEDADLIVLWGDSTALPAIAAILEALPGTRRVRAWIEVDDVSDVIQLAAPPDTEINWLVGEDSLENLRTAALPDAEFPYVWIAGESGSVKALRRHFVQERGIDRRRVTFVGYWRRGMSEEELRAAGE